MYNLNKKQEEALFAENKRLLVLASAGSGKTKILIQKLLHLLSEQRVKPSSTLTITFTRNAANEITDRLIMAGDNKDKYEESINNKTFTKEQKGVRRLDEIRNKSWLQQLTVKTFHGLCFRILQDSDGVFFDNKFRLLLNKNDPDKNGESNKNVAPETKEHVFHKILMKQCKNVNYLLKLKRYILDFYIDRSFTENTTQPMTYPNTSLYTTLSGDIVKSKSERDIADWLYRHNIKYVYEPKVNMKNFNFKPDFFIPQADLYIEHVSNISYNTKDKEREFKLGGRNCARTDESMMQNSALFNMEMEKILSGKITDSISQIASLKYEEEFRGYQDKVSEFLDMVKRVLSMAQLDSIPLNELLTRSSEHKHERVRVFYDLAIKIMNGYQEYCVDKSYLDYNDLLIKTIHLLENDADTRKIYNERYKYILVDEFQDVNGLQVKLLNLLLTPDTQLFCVGDDWQSIYGFTGSDVEYIINFGKYFESAKVITLDVNYRSNEAIVEASSEVIKNNKFKIEKKISAYKKTPDKIQIYRAKEMYVDDITYLIENILQLQEKGYGPEDILILYRRRNTYEPYRVELEKAGVKVISKSIHASKGLEAKAVFIVGLTDRADGFPQVWLDDTIFTVIKNVKHEMLMEEERRIFYVALTRAKEELHLITELGCESSFIDEIPERFLAVNKTIFKNVINPINICTTCGTEIKESYKFCPTCGHDAQ